MLLLRSPVQTVGNQRVIVCAIQPRSPHASYRTAACFTSQSSTAVTCCILIANNLPYTNPRRMDGLVDRVRSRGLNPRSVKLVCNEGWRHATPMAMQTDYCGHLLCTNCCSIFWALKDRRLNPPACPGNQTQPLPVQEATALLMNLPVRIAIELQEFASKWLISIILYLPNCWNGLAYMDEPDHLWDVSKFNWIVFCMSQNHLLLWSHYSCLSATG
jgi:hypothetical protein